MAPELKLEGRPVPRLPRRRPPRVRRRPTTTSLRRDSSELRAQRRRRDAARATARRSGSPPRPGEGVALVPRLRRRRAGVVGLPRRRRRPRTERARFEPAATAGGLVRGDEPVVVRGAGIPPRRARASRSTPRQGDIVRGGGGSSRARRRRCRGGAGDRRARPRARGARRAAAPPAPAARARAGARRRRRGPVRLPEARGDLHAGSEARHADPRRRDASPAASSSRSTDDAGQIVTAACTGDVPLHARRAGSSPASSATFDERRRSGSSARGTRC